MTLRVSIGGQLYAGVLAIFRSLHALGGFEDGLADTHVGAAAAHVAAETVLYVVQGGVGVFGEEALSGHDEARGAVSALLGVVIDEGGGDGVADGETFDGLDVAALGIDGEHVTGVDTLACKQDGAGSTDATIADLLGAGVVEAIAQRVEQGDRGLDRKVDGFAVDVEGDGDGAGADDSGGGGGGLGISFEEARSHSARADAHATEESAAGNGVLGFRVFG